jgi:pimeloyl-ACP methyl ester carboxylesterase
MRGSDTPVGPASDGGALGCSVASRALSASSFAVPARSFAWFASFFARSKKPTRATVALGPARRRSRDEVNRGVVQSEDALMTTTSMPVAREIAVGADRVSVYEYGVPDGRPVLAFHGTPACGAGFDWADEPARVRGLRIVAPDRPGVGRSTPHTGWGVGDYPAMVVRLADSLGMDRFGVWGYSGGGPYAVACAAKLGERLTATVVSAGMGQMGVWATADEFEKTDRQMLGLATRHRAVARVMMGTVGRAARLSPKTAIKSFEKQMSPADWAVMQKLGEPKQAMALFTQAFTRGARGVVDDYAAIARPWDVDLTAIKTPVFVVHGDADPMVPLSHSRELVDRVPGAHLTVWPGEGHLATITHVGEILDVFQTD